MARGACVMEKRRARERSVAAVVVPSPVTLRFVLDIIATTEEPACTRSIRAIHGHLATAEERLQIGRDTVPPQMILRSLRFDGLFERGDDDEARWSLLLEFHGALVQCN